MRVLVDVHTHILPEVEEGLRFEDTLPRVNQILQAGTSHVLSLAPYQHDTTTAPLAKLEAVAEAYQEALDRRGLPLLLYPGHEALLEASLADDVLAGKVSFADLNQRYLFIRFPDQDLPACTQEVLFSLLAHNIRPIISQPEKQACFQKKTQLLYDICEQGCSIQASATSLLPSSPAPAYRLAWDLVERRYLHVIASGAFCASDSWRGDSLASVYQYLEEKYGESFSFDLKQNAISLLNGDPMVTHYQLKKKRTFFDFFKRQK